MVSQLLEKICCMSVPNPTEELHVLRLLYEAPLEHYRTEQKILLGSETYEVRLPAQNSIGSVTLASSNLAPFLCTNL